MLFMVHEGNSINLLAQKKEKILAYYIHIYEFSVLQLHTTVATKYTLQK